jgi:hypothetical protein
MNSRVYGLGDMYGPQACDPVASAAVPECEEENLCKDRLGSIVVWF